jgi:hypothetical protein
VATKSSVTGPKPVQPETVSREQLATILERTCAVLSAEEHATLTGAIDTLALVTAQLQTKDASIERLRRMIFGASTESTRNVLGEPTSEQDSAASTATGEPANRARRRPVMDATPPPRTRALPK